MLKVKNTTNHYGVVTIFLHWLMAVLIIGLLALGVYMVDMPDVGFNIHKIKLIFLHKELGIGVLVLATVRFMWRLSNIVPRLSQIPQWQKIAARAVHLAFYGFMFAMQITGWLMSSAAGIPVTFLGWIVLPD